MTGGGGGGVAVLVLIVGTVSPILLCICKQDSVVWSRTCDFFVIVVVEMGCNESKAVDTELVIRCRERKDLIRAAADHRYALAAAHVSYFHSLRDVGEALRKFVDEELIVGSSSSAASTPSSPSLILPGERKIKSDSNRRNAGSGAGAGHGGGRKGNRHTKHKSDGSPISTTSSSSSISRFHDEDDEVQSHLHLSSDSSDSDNHEHSHPHSHSHSHSHSDLPQRGNSRGHRHVDEGDDESHMGHSHGFRHVHELGEGHFVDERGGPSISSFPQMPWQQQYGMNPAPQPGFWEPFYGLNPQFQSWEQQLGGNPNSNTYAYYMKRSSPVMKTMIHEAEQVSTGHSNSYWSYPENGGMFGYPMGSTMGEMRGFEGKKPSPPKEPPPPPSPKASVWDFFNPFDAFDSGYSGYASHTKSGYGSVGSSPDSTEVREREGIPDLEEETETEIYKEYHMGKNSSNEWKRKSSVEGSTSSRAVPLHRSVGSSRAGPSKSSESGRESMPHDIDSRAALGHSSRGSTKLSSSLHNEGSSSSRRVETEGGGGSSEPISPRYNEGSHLSSGEPSHSSDVSGSIEITEEKSNSETLVSRSPEFGHLKKKGVTFVVDEVPENDFESSKSSSLATLHAHGTRDLHEVVAEIRDEFEVASSYGREVALMLEVGKLPYQPSFAKGLLSRILYLIVPSMSVSNTSSVKSVRLASKARKLAKSYFGDVGDDSDMKNFNLSSTLDELCEWEKKLYKEVKDEERLRIIYEKQCRRLRTLDEQGAESSKIDVTRASIRKLLTKLNVCVKAIDAISSRIHTLRDEELQHQVAELIYGLVRMWRSMLKCHKKQFQAVMESKTRALKANTGFQRDSSLRATIELEMQLVSWSRRFNDWICNQKSYVESLNGWLMRCLDYEPEETPDGPVPFSPGRLGAPPVFVICNDWSQSMEAISESRVAMAMNNFASNLRKLWERQDEEQRQRVKAEYLSKDYKKRLTTLQMKRGNMQHEQDAMSERSHIMVPPEKGVSPHDDLKVDLDSFRKKLVEERAKHKDTIKLVHDAASSSLQGGLLPIFKALENFTSEALRAHEQVRLQSVMDGS